MFNIIIVNWNSYEDTVNCINSLLVNCTLISEILIVDNASTDNSYNQLETYLSVLDNKLIKIVKSHSNTGYCGGNNFGFTTCINSKSVGNYILVVNNDVKISTNTLGCIKSAFDENPNLAIVSPMVNKEMIRNSKFLVKIGNQIGINFNKYEPLRTIDYKFYVPGCAVAFRKEFLVQYGGFEEHYFMYVEEIEIAFRAWLNGYSVGQLKSHESNVIRKEDSKDKLDKPYIWYYQTRNMLLFIDKVFKASRFTAIILKVKYIIYSALRPFKQRKIKNIKSIANGIIDYFSGNTGKMKQ
ncbi:glycosyltransferase family 2 protein [Enterobacter mori]|uniref:glycosyltransferase family 2 protein n=1 Tax=Enterobacter mori TaxID=539813 RepID=UPI001C45BD3F|nr:glycosyltransferase family 2 protein [Enterobacter mori]QXM22581.1 glycosyltransferase family 2 protein [Enterobacter mori]